jgi:hypothetical protein
MGSTSSIEHEDSSPTSSLVPWLYLAARFRKRLNGSDAERRSRPSRSAMVLFMKLIFEIVCGSNILRK